MSEERKENRLDSEENSKWTIKDYKWFVSLLSIVVIIIAIFLAGIAVSKSDDGPIILNSVSLVLSIVLSVIAIIYAFIKGFESSRSSRLVQHELKELSVSIEKNTHLKDELQKADQLFFNENLFHILEKIKNESPLVPNEKQYIDEYLGKKDELLSDTEYRIGFQKSFERLKSSGSKKTSKKSHSK